jgi:hypothetical protein
MKKQIPFAFLILLFCVGNVLAQTAKEKQNIIQQMKNDGQISSDCVQE